MKGWILFQTWRGKISKWKGATASVAPSKSKRKKNPRVQSCGSQLVLFSIVVACVLVANFTTGLLADSNRQATLEEVCLLWLDGDERKRTMLVRVSPTDDDCAGSMSSQNLSMKSQPKHLRTRIR